MKTFALVGALGALILPPAARTPHVGARRGAASRAAAASELVGTPTYSSSPRSDAMSRSVWVIGRCGSLSVKRNLRDGA